ncbi:ATP-dependent DNA ligase [Blyttiomyces helicus]|uniref:ATP-dependent DNA ligase n=1 Tax=Blyttiomyces helicus TaxID=388810 RepID=A0A4P9WQN0_9FUNG|nr:ATP-dependent DNA ligase [Blyttiomyces helicus]|eukprot:RKO94705.1 ATP-dependent DNA ligase [Blyttiomyces helicus]
MPIIKKPLLATNVVEAASIRFPCFVTPKIDGIRAIRVDESLVSRQFKPIPNRKIRETLQNLLPDGADGEIMIPGSFRDVTSAVMTSKGTESYSKPFTFYWFDFVQTEKDAEKPYLHRMDDMKHYISKHPHIMEQSQATIIPLYPKKIESLEELVTFEQYVLDKGFEGVMIRKGDGFYKMGRSTLNEGILLKLKRFSDSEALLIRVNELFNNNNEKKATETGGWMRPTKKAGLSSSATMGSFTVRTPQNVEFNIGSGFTNEMRIKFYQEKDKLIGKIVKYKYFEIGVKNLPRFPTFLGFRDPEDIS